STGFINARRQDLDTEIDRADAEMAACVGSDRAYFVMYGHAERLHLLHTAGSPPPPDGPAVHAELATRMGVYSAGMVVVPRVSRMPVGENRQICLALGLGGWAYVTNTTKDGASVALGFDAIGSPCRITAAGELSLLRMALDTIVQAVERHAI